MKLYRNKKVIHILEGEAVRERCHNSYPPYADSGFDEIKGKTLCGMGSMGGFLFYDHGRCDYKLQHKILDSVRMTQLGQICRSCAKTWLKRKAELGEIPLDEKERSVVIQVYMEWQNDLL